MSVWACMARASETMRLRCCAALRTCASRTASPSVSGVGDETEGEAVLSAALRPVCHLTTCYAAGGLATVTSKFVGDEPLVPPPSLRITVW